ncbi:MAG: hypothetical protein VX433_01055 [Candidatus Thermoplasmatota archaeon]|nr:hypothetical protein [Candidatus Thermoplasmatota archaeon]
MDISWRLNAFVLDDSSLNVFEKPHRCDVFKHHAHRIHNGGQGDL